MGSYRGMAADERRHQRRTALLEAALDCLHEDGLAGVSVRSVCARARLTARYFYESFDDLDALLEAVVDGVAAEVRQCSVAAFVSAPDALDERVHAAIDAGYGVVATDPRKASAMLVAASGHGPLRERRHLMVTEFADVLLEHPALATALRGRDSRAEFRVRALFLMGATAEVFEAALSQRVRMSRRRVVALLTQMWLGVLRGTG